MMQSVLIWTGAVPLAGCWVQGGGSPRAGRLCAPSITAAQAHLTQPAAQMNKLIRAGKLGFSSWDSQAFSAPRSGILPAPVIENSELQPKSCMGIILTLRGLNSPFDFRASATHVQTLSVATHRAQHLAGLSPSLILLNPGLLTFKATHQGFLSTFPEQAACLSWAFLH